MNAIDEMISNAAYELGCQAGKIIDSFIIPAQLFICPYCHTLHNTLTPFEQYQKWLESQCPTKTPEPEPVPKLNQQVLVEMAWLEEREL